MKIGLISYKIEIIFTTQAAFLIKKQALGSNGVFNPTSFKIFFKS